MKYSFKGELWKHEGTGGWCFITLPSELSKKIRKAHAESEEGWGRLKTEVTIKESSWKTAIWFDTKRGSYLLPVKAVIRKKAGLAIGSSFKVALVIDV